MYFTGSFSYGNPFGFCEAWRASYFLIYTICRWQANTDQYRQLVITFQLSPRHLMKASAFWGRQHHEGVNLMKASAFREPFEASHRQWWMLWGLTDTKAPISQYCCRHPRCQSKTSVYLFLSHIKQGELCWFMCMFSLDLLYYWKIKLMSFVITFFKSFSKTIDMVCWD